MEKPEKLNKYSVIYQEAIWCNGGSIECGRTAEFTIWAKSKASALKRVVNITRVFSVTKVKRVK